MEIEEMVKNLKDLWNCDEAQVSHANTKDGPVMVESKQEVREEVISLLQKISDYVRSIIDLTTAYNDKSNQNYKDEVERRDKYRRACHDSVIAQFHVINRVCKYLDMPEVMPDIDTPEVTRKIIAMRAFAIFSEMVKELY